MKKILLFGLATFLLVGCMSKTTNTPTSETENLLKKYQTLDSGVVTQVNDVVFETDSLTEEQQLKYKQLLTNNYRDLTYTIVSEVITGDTAVVTVEVEVNDYATSMNEFDPENITEENETIVEENETVVEENEENNEVVEYDYNDQILDYVLTSKYRTKHTIEVHLTKVDKTWKVDDLDTVTMEKLSGFYNATLK